MFSVTSITLTQKAAKLRVAKQENRVFKTPQISSCIWVFYGSIFIGFCHVSSMGCRYRWEFIPVM